jgi:hypothetical protein
VKSNVLAPLSAALLAALVSAANAQTPPAKAASGEEGRERPRPVVAA